MERYTRRAFPPYRHEPGRTPHPERSPEGYRYREEWEASASDASLAGNAWRDNELYLYGVDLFNAGYFWEAHAAWEVLWVAANDDETKAFLRSLIQLAAGCLKRSTGRPRGAGKLFASACSRLERLAESRPILGGIDLRALSAAVESLESTICIVLQV